MQRGGGDLRTELPCDSTRKLIATLGRDDARRYLNAVARYGTDLPVALPKYGGVGYCWGGSTSFAATREAWSLTVAWFRKYLGVRGQTIR